MQSWTPGMDQDQAMFLKRKYRLFNIFYVQNLFWSLCPQFQEYEAKIFQFLVNCVIFYIFVTALSLRNNNYGTQNKS